MKYSWTWRKTPMKLVNKYKSTKNHSNIETWKYIETKKFCWLFSSLETSRTPLTVYIVTNKDPNIASGKCSLKPWAACSTRKSWHRQERYSLWSPMTSSLTGKRNTPPHPPQMLSVYEAGVHSLHLIDHPQSSLLPLRQIYIKCHKMCIKQTDKKKRFRSPQA